MYERRFPFVQLDVFTAKPLECNQLAVFTDARCLSDVDMVALERERQIQAVYKGVTCAIVPLKSVEALGRVRLDMKKAESYLDRTDTKFLYFITPTTVANEAPSMRARMIFYNGEDPATGSAAGC